MKWHTIFFGLSLLLALVAFNKKGRFATVLTHTKADTPIVCKPPSRQLLARSYKAVSSATGKDENKMVLIPGGSFEMGSPDFEDALPVHQVRVRSFLMDEHEVTNAQFAKFVAATHYISIAERKLNPADYPSVPKDKLVAGSAVFVAPDRKVSLNNPWQWWKYIAGASWKYPLGAGSSIIGKDNEPVVQIAYPDAVAYAHWAGKRLPTEAEWEFAARAGRPNQKFYWGSELTPSNKWMANIFQGSFPNNNTAEDGFTTTAPVKSFPANPYGLYDMEGNVWEWCSDLYRPDYYAQSPASNPSGPKNSYDPDEPGAEKHVQRGGSFLCSDQYCIRYKAGSRGKGETNSAGNNLGFRCVKDSK
jgi:formylglycine-generating enzyme required for sulfatase activity